MSDYEPKRLERKMQSVTPCTPLVPVDDFLREVADMARVLLGEVE